MIIICICSLKDRPSYFFMVTTQKEGRKITFRQWSEVLWWVHTYLLTLPNAFLCFNSQRSPEIRTIVKEHWKYFPFILYCLHVFVTKHFFLILSLHFFTYFIVSKEMFKGSFYNINVSNYHWNGQMETTKGVNMNMGINWIVRGTYAVALYANSGFTIFILMTVKNSRLSSAEILLQRRII